MDYLLSSLNSTTERASAIRDFIRMGFGMNPRDIRYDRLASMDLTVKTSSENDRNAIISERIHSLVEEIQSSMDTKIEVNGINIDSDVNISLTINDQLLEFKL